MNLSLDEQIKKMVSNRKLFQFGCAIFAGLIVWQIVSGARLFSDLNQAVQQYELNEKRKKTSKVIQPTATLNTPLFGDYVPRNLNAAAVRPSMLNFTVVGVLLSENEEDSQVLLRKSNGQEEFFTVGDELPGGVIIKRVTSDGVIVLHDGVLERLSLPKDELNFDAPVEPMNED